MTDNLPPDPFDAGAFGVPATRIGDAFVTPAGAIVAESFTATAIVNRQADGSNPVLLVAVEIKGAAGPDQPLQTLTIMFPWDVVPGVATSLLHPFNDGLQRLMTEGWPPPPPPPASTTPSASDNL